MAFSKKNRSSSSRPKRSRDRSPFGRSRRASVPPDYVFDYKDTGTLVRFLGPTGKIIPRRITRITAYQQRALTTEIKRARQLALLPYTGHQLEQKKGPF